MRTKTKSIKAMITSALAVCLLLSLAMFATQSGEKVVFSADGNAEKAICITLDTESAGFASGTDGLNPTDSVAFAVMPFPVVNDTLDALKNDALGEWWNGFGNVEISYDFYSDAFMPGMDGVCIFVGSDPWIIGNSDYTDDAGNHVTVQSADTERLYENGWRRRTFNVNVSMIAEHLGFVFCVQKQHLPTTGTVKLYYKNVTLKHHGVTYNLFGQVDDEGNEIGVFTSAGVNKTANGEAFTGGYVTRRIWNEEYGTMNTFTGVGAMRATRLGASFEAIDAPSLISVNTSVPSGMVTSKTYDLTSFAVSSVAVELVSAAKNGAFVDLSEADITNYSFEAGEWELVYKAEKDGQTAVGRVSFEVGEVAGNNVTFVYGNGSPASVVRVEEGGKAQRPETDPARVGYAFGGWKNADGYDYDFDAVITEDTAIYASWNGLAGSSAIRIYIDTASEQFATDYAKAERDDTKFIFGVSPFPAVNDTGASLKNNGISDWWNAWGESEISFEFWSPDYLPGMLGVSFTLDADPWFFKQGDFTDGNGYLSNCYEEKFISALTNGWYKRTFEVNMGNTIPRDIYFLFAVEKKDLPASGVIEIYIRNVKITCHGVTFGLFGGADDIYGIEGVNSVAENKAYQGFTRTTPVWMLDWTAIRDMTGSGENAANVTLGAAFEGTECPDITSVTAALPEILYTDTVYDLTSYAGGAAVSSIRGKNGEIDLEGKDTAAFIFEEAGEYSVTYAAAKNGYVSTKTLVAVVADINMPVIIESDVAAAVPASAYAHESVSLGSVYASVRGEKTLKAIPSVTNSDGDVFAVSETAEGWSFVPTAKKNDVYTVVYTAENNAGKTVSAGYSVSVADVDKPVIDLTGIDGFTIGNFYEVSKLIGLIKISDISDGTVGVASISVVDPLGNELIGENTEKFMAAYSGIYTISVVSEADSDGNLSEMSVNVTANQSEGLVLSVIASIDEGSRAEGVLKQFDTQILHPDNCALNVGDVISYDVMAYTVYQDGTYGYISGLGAITGQMDGTWVMMYSLFQDLECLDESGYSMARSADLSAVLHDESGPVWYSRNYKVRSGDAVYGQVLYHFAVGFSTEAACGEKIVVMYRNVRIYDAEGNVKCVLWSGAQGINREWTHASDGVSGVAVATFDVSPVAIEGKIPVSAAYGEEISISKNLMKDPAKDEIIASDIKVYAPDGTEVELSETLTGYTFTVGFLGNYRIVVSAVNDKGYSTVKEYGMSVADNSRPTITFVTDKESYEEGDAVIVTVTVSDDIFAIADFAEIGCRLSLDGEEAEGNVTATATGYTVTFTAVKGEYTVLAYATDGAGNETVETFVVSVSEKTVAPDTSSVGETDSGTKVKTGCINGIAGSSAVSLIAAAAFAIVCRRKRK
ncbi:MAG: InlB B-repeat-containing protein [Clostridia bacterium]|nr:InlB B-repeat-containing protein [Clostridia bacterium]